MSNAFSQSRFADALRLIRWRGRRMITALRCGPAELNRSPVLFGNSVPKSGTHLLAQVLQAFPRLGLAVERGMGPILTFERQTGRQHSTQEILHDLKQLRPADLCFGHVLAAPEILAYWEERNIVHYFMLRDPRDVVISHAFYIADKATQNVHHVYYQSLPSLDERIRVSILGRPDWKGYFPDIRARYALYLGWLESPQVCLLRYEDFIQDRPQNLMIMVDYAKTHGFQTRLPDDQVISVLMQAIQPKKSFTFRKGEAGNWREHFTEEHNKLFKETAGDLLIILGYEKSLNW